MPPFRATRRRACFSLAASLSAITLGLTATPDARGQSASALPATMRIVVPAAPGSSTDAVARAVAPLLAARLGNTVIVENKPGASTLLGAQAVAKSPKDGSTLLINSVSLLSAGATAKAPLLDVVNDLTPVAALMQTPLVVATSVQSNIRTPAELVAAARAKPDTITHGSAGIGTIAHIAQELLDQAAHIQTKHVPYRGAAPAVMDMAGGTIDMVIGAYSTVLPAVNSGRARVIAVTSAQPNPAFANVPTMASVAPGYAIDLWMGIFAPAGTPVPVVQRLHRELTEIAKSDKLREMMAVDAGVPVSATPDELKVKVRDTFAAFRKLATEKGIVIE